MRYISIFLLLATFSNCLKPKKSLFDFSSPAGFGFLGIFLTIANSNSNIQIGGNISGFTFGTLILKNNTEQKTIQANESNYSFSVSRNSNYEISVVTNPVGFACSVSNSKGTASSNISNININCSVPVFQSAFPINGKNWNDYIQRDYSKSLLNQTDTPCNPANPSNENYFSCIHAAEIRKLEIPDKQSCTDDLTAEDNANNTGGAFNWVCTVQNSKLIFYSTGFRNGDLGDLKNNPPPGLSDLIDWTLNPPAFKKLKITVKEKGVSFLETTPEVWWGNTFRNNAACPLTITGGEINTIFTFSNNIGNYTINSNCLINSSKISYVVNPNIILSSSGTIIPLNIGTTQINFFWVEGIFNMNSGDGIIVNPVSTVSFIVFRNIKVFSKSGTSFNSSLNLNNIQYSYFKNIIIGNSFSGLGTGDGTRILTTASKNIFENFNSFNNINSGINIFAGTQNLFLNTISSSNNSNGVVVSSANNRLLNLTVGLNNSDGITTTATPNNLFLMNVLTTNNGLGITERGFKNGVDTNITILNISSNNIGNGTNSQIESTGGGSNNRRFMGILRTSNGICSDNTGLTNGIQDTCSPTGQSDFVVSPLIDFTSPLGNNPFIAGRPKASSDSINPNFNSVGTVPYSISNNWTSFQNFYRTIGIDNIATFPNTALVNRCSSGNCQLYDWSFRKTDPSGIRNIVPCPNTVPSLNLYGPIILRNAYEILGDWKGNDDGLCNAQEECIYTPNIGAYQGHGKLETASKPNTDYPTNLCPDTVSSSDGLVTRVKLFKFEKNGY